MEIAVAIISIGVLVFLAHFFAWLFSFVRIPDVLMLMSIGILIGPILGIIDRDFLGEAGSVIVMLILVMILFEGATKLRVQSLQKAIFGTVSLALISFLLTMTGTAFLLWQFAGLNVILSFLIGAIVGSNSTAVVIPLIEKIKIKEESQATLILESGISDVLSIVFTFAFIASLEMGVFQIDSVVFDAGKNLFVATIIGIVTAFLWSMLLNTVHNIKNSSFSTPAFVFMIYGITELLGYSGLIAVIAFGILLGNIPLIISSLKEKSRFFYTFFHPQPLSSRELSFFCEVVFLIKIFFFIYIGISLNFDNLSILVLGFLLAVAIFLIRIIAIIISVPKSTPKFDASIISVAAPRGLAPAVLALIPIQKGLAGGQIVQDTAYSVIFFSIFFASILIFLIYNTRARKFYEKILPGFTKNPAEGSKEYPLEEEK
jgi:potassium/hydrogen antiporter